MGVSFLLVFKSQLARRFFDRRITMSHIIAHASLQNSMRNIENIEFDPALPCDVWLKNSKQNMMYFVVVVGKEGVAATPSDALARVRKAEAFMESRNSNGRVLVFLTTLNRLKEYQRYQQFLLESVSDRTALLPVDNSDILKVIRKLPCISYPLNRNGGESQTKETMCKALKVVDGIGDKAANIIATKNISLRSL